MYNLLRYTPCILHIKHAILKKQNGTMYDTIVYMVTVYPRCGNYSHRVATLKKDITNTTQ